MDEQIIEGGPKKSSQKSKVIGIAVVVVVVALIFFNWKQTTTAPAGNADQNFQTDNSNSISSESANYPDLALLAGLKKLELAKDFESWTPDSKIETGRVKNFKIAQKGEISEAYVYLQASVEAKKLTKFDSLYLKFNGQGGHLFRPSSLALPDSDQTQVLFPLEKISYLPSIPYDESRAPTELNALSMFGPDKSINVYSFLSSWRSGQIQELSLFYGCKEESDCSLEIK